LPYYRQEALTPKVQDFINDLTLPILINHLTLVAHGFRIKSLVSNTGINPSTGVDDSRTFLSTIKIGLYRILPVSEQEFKRAESLFLIIKYLKKPHPPLTG